VFTRVEDDAELVEEILNSGLLVLYRLWTTRKLSGARQCVSLSAVSTGVGATLQLAD
jgi:hypothetical protein